MKVSHLIVKEHELMSSCIVRYSLVVVHVGTDWITSIGGLAEMEWGSTAEEVRGFAR
jgi:hypothetical protein